MSETFLLRAETKSNEFRRALVPKDCSKLIEAGHEVIVENWKNSIIPIQDYIDVGCKVSEEGSWPSADSKTIVVGLKALPESLDEFKHRHIYFAHVFKKQDGYEKVLSSFVSGGGNIIDLEYMVDDKKRRVCAFGYWAGYVGAALGVLFTKNESVASSIDELARLKRFSSKEKLIEFIEAHNSFKGESIVIGAHGRSGKGALDCLQELNWHSTAWDREDTSSGGPFGEILNNDLFVNCVLSTKKLPPFLTKEFLKESHKLSMISDVSCDPDSDCNVIPIYNRATLIENPLLKINENVNLIAIDNLPSVLPRESSEDFSSQLVEHLIAFNESTGPISRALSVYRESISSFV